MAKLSIYMPIKPLVVNQAFGIYNPVYKQFGFTEHNGIDLAVYDGEPAFAPFDGYVQAVGENSSAGKFVKIKTAEPVEAEGRTGVVCFMFMHGKEILVKQGMSIKAGDKIMLCDNTGFSTGHHLHISAYFIDEGGRKIKHGRVESDWCFDFSKYWNRFYAVDAQKVLSLYHQIIALLTLWLNKK